MSRRFEVGRGTICGGAVLLLLAFAQSLGQATPANKVALSRHYERFLATKLNDCTTCHLPAKLEHPPESLDEFPHNSFGARLRSVKSELGGKGSRTDLRARLSATAQEDADGDGVANELELLLGHAPGDAADTPNRTELEQAQLTQAEFNKFLASYRWEPFETVRRPMKPDVGANVGVQTATSSNGGREFINGQFTNVQHDSRGVAFPIRNPIDAFVAAEHRQRGLRARPEAPKETLLRRVYLDLIGLTPTPEEQHAFITDTSTDAYEKVVDRLLLDPRHGERWGRHWMDVWRYSDWAGWTDGGQVRDSKPHIWRWRDWIVESLNDDKPYNQMVLEMLAADELDPENTNSLRATGFLVRNYKMLSREQWLEDTVKHTAQAFLGVTVGCAKCHDHMTDPISQKEYYQMRAIFEPHQVRTDRLPGELDVAKDGLVRAYDTDTNAPTYFFIRGDERKPDTNRVMTAGVPVVLCGMTKLAKSDGRLAVEQVALPRDSAHPDERDFVIEDSLAAAAKQVAEARTAIEQTKHETNTTPAKLRELELKLAVAEARQTGLIEVLRAEILGRVLGQPSSFLTKASADDPTVKLLPDAGKGQAGLLLLLDLKLPDSLDASAQDNLGVLSNRWQQIATNTVLAQRNLATREAKLKLHEAQSAEEKINARLDAVLREQEKVEKEDPNNSNLKGEAAKTAKDAEKAAKDLEAAKKKTAEAAKALAEAQKESQTPLHANFKPRPADSYPSTSTGRRLAFARWVADGANPLTARVAMNHIWLRHFGRGIVPTPADFGRNGRPPSHPELLDWLAAELMDQNWSMKAMHRLIVTSSTYRMSSTPEEANAAIDPDNVYLWRMPSRRMEAEVVRDNLLYISGELDPAMGGPDIDQKLGLSSKRRSLYLRIAAEKEVEFLKIFDGPSVTECYERHPSVVPQQALALANSELTLREARLLTGRLGEKFGNDDDQFVTTAFVSVLAREPRAEELALCQTFLGKNSKRLERAVSADGQDISKQEPAQPGRTAREDLVLVLFNHNDFVTIR